MSGAGILVVEDEAIVALDLSQRLARLGYRVVATVAEGEKVAAAVLEHSPDLVLMDLRLAGTLDGIAAAQQIAKVRDVPVVYLTAHSDRETLARACVTGPFGYIIKPFDERELHTQLEIALYRHGAERRVRESEAQLRAVMNTAQDGILTIDKNGAILSTNPAGEEIFGYGAGEMIGLDAGELMPSLHVMMAKDDDQGFVKNRGGSILSVVRELSGKRKDGALLPIEITLSKKNDPQQRNYIGIIRNISRRKQLENKLRRIVDDLRETDRRKDEFLATLSHELRNPLAPIRSVSAILKSMDVADPKFRWCCEILDRQMALVTRLMEDLLDVGRISRGSLILHKEWVDFGEIVRTFVAACGPEVEAAGHKLVVEAADKDVKLFVDPVRLTQILSNLVNNAAKYMDGNGEVRFTAQCQRDEIVIQVKDSGIGISAEFLPSVFEMFRQADSTLERNRGGLGIGLALVKSLVELHGGSVEAASAGLGQGSLFTVRLPVTQVGSIAPEVRPAAAEANDQPARSSRRSKRILIVDDNKLQAQSLGLLVQLWGYEVRLAYDGPGALATLGEYSADVALIDIGLPGISGYEVARQIRERPQWRHMTLIAQTGWGRDSDRDNSGQAGFDHHFTKPLNHDALEKVLDQTAAQNIGASIDFAEIHHVDSTGPMKSS